MKYEEDNKDDCDDNESHEELDPSEFPKELGLEEYDLSGIEKSDVPVEVSIVLEYSGRVKNNLEMDDKNRSEIFNMIKEACHSANNSSDNDSDDNYNGSSSAQKSHSSSNSVNVNWSLENSQ